MSKVSLVRCTDYDTSRVFESVKRAVDLLGGIEHFVKPGMKVLLKPNLLSPRSPDDAVDTHPEVVRALVKLVRAAQAIPTIGDAPGGYGFILDEIFDISGMKRISEEEGVELVKFTSSKFVDGIPMARHVMDSDCLISIPKLKTHVITVLTAAVKNTFGTVVGLYKSECHLKAPQEDDFSKIIAKVHSISKPHLNVLDGIMAMEGDGPSSGILRKMNMIMASPDAVAMDSCISNIIGLNPHDILTTREAHKLGLGEMDLSRIEIVGDDINSFIVNDFKLPQTIPLKVMPRAVVNGIARLVKFRPVIDVSKCRRCNLCKVSCPVDAITIEKDFCKINYTTCVRCLCCHEVCPYGAIDIKRNMLAKVMMW